MKRISITGLLVFVLFLAGYPLSKSYVRSANKYKNGKPLILKGLMGQGSKEEEVTLRLFSYYFIKRNNLDAEIFKTKIEHGFFKFILPAIDKPCYVSLEFSSFENRNKNFKLYLIEPGDSIIMKYGGNKIEFSGKGAEKFNLQFQSDAIPDITWDPGELEFLNNKHGRLFLTKITQKYIAKYSKKISLLRSYKGKITGQAYKQIKFDYEAEKNYTLFYSFRFWLKYKAGIQERVEQIRFFKEHLRDLNTNFGPGRCKASSKFYTDFLMQKIILELSIDNWKENKNPSLENVYYYINKKFKGTVREKLLVILFIQKSTLNEEQHQYLQNVINYCKDIYLKKILLQIADTRSSGKDAYNFSLQNNSGDLVQLKDFKGKVLIIDFWFSGCIACRSLENGMKPVRKTFQGDSNVVFISINADKEEETWKANLLSELYSGRDETNLFTNGLGTEHPLLKYYGFIGFPQLIIVDKMLKIVSVNPPYPFDKISQTKFIQIIQNELRAIE